MSVNTLKIVDYFKGLNNAGVLGPAYFLIGATEELVADRGVASVFSDVG